MRIRDILRIGLAVTAMVFSCTVAMAGSEFRDFVVQGAIADADRIELRVANAKGEVVNGATLYAKANTIEGSLPIPLGERVEIRMEVYDVKARLIADGRNAARFDDLRGGLSVVEAVTKAKVKRGELSVAPLKLQFSAEKVDEYTQRFYLSAYDAYGQQAYLSGEDVKWDLPFPGGGTFTPCKSGTGVACVEVRVPVRLNPAVVACVRDLICRSSLSDTATSALTGYRAIAAGYQHTCALTADQRVLCFGSNSRGELGRATTKTCRVSNVPNLPGTFSCDSTPAEVVCSVGQTCRFKSVDAGRKHTCAIDTNNDVLCWGDNFNEQLGFRCANGSTNPNCASSAIPTRVYFPSTAGDLFPKFVQVSTGDSHSCALSERGNVFCWGDSSFSQTGGQSVSSPHRVNSLQTYIQVAAGRDHSCAVTVNGDLDCWGGNNQAQIRPISLISNDIFYDPTPVRGYHSSLAGKITRVTASDMHTCVQDDVNGVVCWGGSQASDVIVASRAAIDIELGHDSAVFGTPACAITNGLASCALARSTLTAVMGSPDRLIDVTSGNSHMCAVRDNGEAFCWGPDNIAGQMGDGTTAAHAIPARVLGP